MAFIPGMRYSDSVISLRRAIGGGMGVQPKTRRNHMRIPYRIMLCCAAALLAFSPFSARAAQDVSGDAVSSVPGLPVVQLKHWKNSSTAERHAFLMGFVSMAQMESAWQGKNALPVEQSTAATWMRGLAGVTIPQMDAALNSYMDKYPNAMDMAVIETLGRIYVRPNLTDKERGRAAKRVETLNTEHRK